MNDTLLTSPAAIVAALASVCALFFYLQRRTRWKLFDYVPPLLFIYLVPVGLSNTGILPSSSGVYAQFSDILLPLFLTLLMLDVNVKATFRVAGKGIFVLLIGTAGVIIGAPIGYALVRHSLGPETWKGFGALAGSWIGGTGNMAAVGEGLEISGTDFGLAVLADNGIFLVWLPLLLASKNFGAWYHRFTGAKDDHIQDMRTAAGEMVRDKGTIEMRHIIYLLFIGCSVAAVSSWLATLIPTIEPVFSTNTYRILIVTTLGLIISFTPARLIPGSHTLAMAFVYLFVANMGAKASLTGLAGMAPWFILGSAVWILIHGAFVIFGARIFKMDIHTAAIASAANIGGVASAPIVAAHHDERLVPVSILMALIGYAIGNYGGFAVAYLCHHLTI